MTDRRIEKLVSDNPNLSASKLAKLAGAHKNTIINVKKKLGVSPNWFHFGVGIPFIDYDSIVTAYRLRKDGRKIYNGSFTGVMENLDRLIFCLENNNGKLPRTIEELVFNDLRFQGAK